MAGVEQSYHGNPNLKPIGYQHDFTKEEFEEFVKCEQDPIYFIENPLLIFALWHGGMAFHGGLIGMAVATWIFARRNEIQFIAFGDLVCAAAPIGLFFGRIANFING